MKKIFFFLILFFLFIETSSIKAFEIFNITSSSKSLVYEIKNDNSEKHDIFIFDIDDNNYQKIYSNNGDEINSDVFFPSISTNGKYIVYTSRATNITNEKNNKCFDVYTKKYEYCSNIYIYDVENKKSEIIKINGENFNGDNYIAKISGNGNSIVFESISTNLLANNYNKCTYFDVEFVCINIYQYSLLTKEVTLLSTNGLNVGGNANSISPTISNDGRYITFQSSATNIVQQEDYQYCENENNNFCSNIYYLDINTMKYSIIKNNNELLNNNSGNAIISKDGNYIVYESYASNSVNTNNKLHIYIYDVNNNTNQIITIKNGKTNNRDNYLIDISDNGKYILYRTNSTNLNSGGIMNLYIYNTKNKKSIKITNTKLDILSGVFSEDYVYFYNNEYNIQNTKIDTNAPIIQANQTIYGLIDDIVYVKNKLIVEDDLSNIEDIQISIENINQLYNVGEYNLFVTAIDEFNNISKEKVKFVIMAEDIVGPIFNDINDIKILKGSNTLNISNYVNAYDDIDGYTQIYIIDDGNIDLNITGVYSVKLMSMDKSNNITYKDISITVYENYNFSYYYAIFIIIILIVGVIFFIIKVK